MHPKTVLILLIFTVVSAYAQTTQVIFNKAKFYKAISSESIDLVNAELKGLKKINMQEKEGYEGALLMKKAGLVKKIKDKLDLFKEGHTKLEAAIKKDSNNTEYRFLRIIIQENAPGILKYNGQLNEDSTHLMNNYSSLTSDVKQAVLDYSKKSKIIDSKDFN